MHFLPIEINRHYVVGQDAKRAWARDSGEGLPVLSVGACRRLILVGKAICATAWSLFSRLIARLVRLQSDGELRRE
jgi:hypothetical protein